MSEIIRKYYERGKAPQALLNQKLEKLERNNDILREFEYWIENQKYLSQNCVTVEGYTAEKLAALSPFIDGEGAFMLLIELREQPDKAKKQIQSGFKLK